MGASTWPPNPRSLVAPRRRRGAPRSYAFAGAPTSPFHLDGGPDMAPKPRALVTPRGPGALLGSAFRTVHRSTGSALRTKCALISEQSPNRSSRPSKAVALLDHARLLGPRNRPGSPQS